MTTLIIKGARNSTLAVHKCDTREELTELLSIYRALGYAPESLIVHEEALEPAA